MFNGYRLSRCKDGECVVFSSGLSNIFDSNTGESWFGAISGCDTEGVRRELVERTRGIVEDFDGFGTRVGKGRHNLQVLYIINRAWS